MTHFFKKTFFVLSTTLLIAFGSTAALADQKERLDNASAYVQSMGDKAVALLTDKALPRKEREKRIRKMLNDHFDVAAIGRFAMGRYWREATDAQKKQYLDLFEDMIVETYTARFEEYSGQKFQTGNAVAVGEKDIIVSSSIIQNKGPNVAVDWRVRQSGKNFKVIDVIVEGISMGVTQRSEFAAVIQRGGGKVDALIDSLKKRRVGVAEPGKKS